MPPHADEKPRPPVDFAPVLATKEPLLLVGGQAVNLWALYYSHQTAGLEPFVSRDLDILGTRETLELLAELADSKPQFFPLRPPTNEIGVVIAKDQNGNPMLVQVLRHVHGVSNEELLKSVYTVAVGKSKVRVPGPISLLQAKVANVIDLDQTGRQDEHHVLILARLMPTYLSDLEGAVRQTRLKERRFIDALEKLLQVVTSRKGTTVFAQINSDRCALFSGLDSKDLPKVKGFLENRLPRAIKTQNPRSGG